jgi:hypothetical protein
MGDDSQHVVASLYGPLGRSEQTCVIEKERGSLGDYLGYMQVSGSKGARKRQ